jgi:DNA-binding MarR family transcriptional regulator
MPAEDNMHDRDAGNGNDNGNDQDRERDNDEARDSDPQPAGAPVLDLASRLTQDHHQSLKLWLRMLSCTVRIENEIRSRLRTRFGITLPRFDLMAQLERHPQGLRMGELSKRMMVTGGNITGITDQLEREKLVARVPDPKDRRAYSVSLTPAGRRAFAEMATVHEAWIAELLKDMSGEDKGTLIDLLSQMKRHLNAPDEK